MPLLLLSVLNRLVLAAVTLLGVAVVVLAERVQPKHYRTSTQRPEKRGIRRIPQSGKNLSTMKSKKLALNKAKK